MKKIILVTGNTNPYERIILGALQSRTDLFEIEKVDATVKSPRECSDYIQEFVGNSPDTHLIVFAGEGLGILGHRSITGVCGINARKIINSMEEVVESWGTAVISDPVEKMFIATIISLALDQSDNEKINIWLTGVTKVES